MAKIVVEKETLRVCESGRIIPPIAMMTNKSGSPRTATPFCYLIGVVIGRSAGAMVGVRLGVDVGIGVARMGICPPMLSFPMKGR